MPKWVKGLLVLLAAQLVFVGVWALGDSEDLATPTRPGVVQVVSDTELDGPAPRLTWRPVEGARGRLKDLRGTPVVVHFWGTWCAPCVEELPAILSWSRDNDVHVVAVAVDDDAASLGAFFDGEIPTNVVLSGERTGAFDVERLPVTFLVGAEGQLVRRWDGARAWDATDKREFLE